MEPLRCADCGELIESGDAEPSFRRPDEYVQTPFWRRLWRSRCNGDLCILRGKKRFIYGLIEFPVVNSDRKYAVGLWVEVDEAPFKLYVDYYNSDQSAPLRSKIVGNIANEIPGLYECPCLGVPVEIKAVPNERPRLRVLGEHKLRTEQDSGISQHRIHEYLALLRSQLEGVA